MRAYKRVTYCLSCDNYAQSKMQSCQIREISALALICFIKKNIYIIFFFFVLPISNYLAKTFPYIQFSLHMSRLSHKKKNCGLHLGWACLNESKFGLHLG